VVPWAALVALIQPHARGAHQALGGRPPFPIETMLRIHCLQLWWNLSDPAMEEELHERPLYRRLVGLGEHQAVDQFGVDIALPRPSAERMQTALVDGDDGSLRRGTGRPKQRLDSVIKKQVEPAQRTRLREMRERHQRDDDQPADPVRQPVIRPTFHQKAIRSVAATISRIGQ
jgi:hypothetical protein